MLGAPANVFDAHFAMEVFAEQLWIIIFISHIDSSWAYVTLIFASQIGQI